MGDVQKMWERGTDDLAAVVEAAYGDASFAFSDSRENTFSSVGGDTPFMEKWTVAVLAGAGFRQSAINVLVNRASGQDVVWDGNPDCCIKVLARNQAANAANEGAVRALDVQARNQGTNISWCNAINANARNDSGKTAYQLKGIDIRCENYGTLETEAVGIDINLSIENVTGAPVRHGLRIRNTDQSGMTACEAAINISHTSTNGFDNLFALSAAAGDGATAAAVALNGLTTAYKLFLTVNGVSHYIPVVAA